MGKAMNWARARRRAVQHTGTSKSQMEQRADKILEEAAAMWAWEQNGRSMPSTHRFAGTLGLKRSRGVLITTGPLVDGCLTLHQFPTAAAARAAGFDWIAD